MKSITIDTGLLIVFIDKKKDYEHVKTMFRWHTENKISLHASNRTIEHDIAGMDNQQKCTLLEVMKEHKIPIHESTFRLSFSLLSGGDFFGGGSSARTPEEMKNFASIVGPDPTTLPPRSIGNKLSNKLGDYDSLCDHYASGRDVFVTLDNSDYLNEKKRDHYAKKLGLSIMFPCEFVAKFRSLA